MKRRESVAVMPALPPLFSVRGVYGDLLLGTVVRCAVVAVVVLSS